MTTKNATDTELIEVGTRVRHRRFPALVGTVKELRPTIEGGWPSIFPYKVQWDDVGQAQGHFDPRYAMFMAHDELEVVV